MINKNIAFSKASRDGRFPPQPIDRDSTGVHPILSAPEISRAVQDIQTEYWEKKSLLLDDRREALLFLKAINEQRESLSEEDPYFRNDHRRLNFLEQNIRGICDLHTISCDPWEIQSDNIEPISCRDILDTIHKACIFVESTPGIPEHIRGLARDSEKVLKGEIFAYDSYDKIIAKIGANPAEWQLKDLFKVITGISGEHACEELSGEAISEILTQAETFGCEIHPGVKALIAEVGGEKIASFITDQVERLAVNFNEESLLFRVMQNEVESEEFEIEANMAAADLLSEAITKAWHGFKSTTQSLLEEWSEYIEYTDAYDLNFSHSCQTHGSDPLEDTGLLLAILKQTPLKKQPPSQPSEAPSDDKPFVEPQVISHPQPLGIGRSIPRATHTIPTATPSKTKSYRDALPSVIRPEYLGQIHHLSGEKIFLDSGHVPSTKHFSELRGGVVVTEFDLPEQVSREMPEGVAKIDYAQYRSETEAGIGFRGYDRQGDKIWESCYMQGSRETDSGGVSRQIDDQLKSFDPKEVALANLLKQKRPSLFDPKLFDQLNLEKVPIGIAVADTVPNIVKDDRGISEMIANGKQERAKVLQDALDQFKDQATIPIGNNGTLTVTPFHSKTELQPRSHLAQISLDLANTLANFRLVERECAHAIDSGETPNLVLLDVYHQKAKGLLSGVSIKTKQGTILAPATNEWILQAAAIMEGRLDRKVDYEQLRSDRTDLVEKERSSVQTSTDTVFRRAKESSTKTFDAFVTGNQRLDGVILDLPTLSAQLKQVNSEREKKQRRIDSKNVATSFGVFTGNLVRSAKGQSSIHRDVRELRESELELEQEVKKREHHRDLQGALSKQGLCPTCEEDPYYFEKMKQQTRTIQSSDKFSAEQKIRFTKLVDDIDSGNTERVRDYFRDDQALAAETKLQEGLHSKFGEYIPSVGDNPLFMRELKEQCSRITEDSTATPYQVSQAQSTFQALESHDSAELERVISTHHKVEKPIREAIRSKSGTKFTLAELSAMHSYRRDPADTGSRTRIDAISSLSDTKHSGFKATSKAFLKDSHSKPYPSVHRTKITLENTPGLEQLAEQYEEHVRSATHETLQREDESLRRAEAQGIAMLIIIVYKILEPVLKPLGKAVWKGTKAVSKAAWEKTKTETKRGISNLKGEDYHAEEKLYPLQDSLERSEQFIPQIEEIIGPEAAPFLDLLANQIRYYKINFTGRHLGVSLGKAFRDRLTLARQELDIYTSRLATEKRRCETAVQTKKKQDLARSRLSSASDPHFIKIAERHRQTIREHLERIEECLSKMLSEQFLLQYREGLTLIIAQIAQELMTSPPQEICAYKQKEELFGMLERGLETEANQTRFQKLLEEIYLLSLTDHLLKKELKLHISDKLKKELRKKSSQAAPYCHDPLTKINAVLVAQSMLQKKIFYKKHHLDSDGTTLNTKFSLRKPITAWELPWLISRIPCSLLQQKPISSLNEMAANILILSRGQEDLAWVPENLFPPESSSSSAAATAEKKELNLWLEASEIMALGQILKREYQVDPDDTELIFSAGIEFYDGREATSLQTLLNNQAAVLESGNQPRIRAFALNVGQELEGEAESGNHWVYMTIIRNTEDNTYSLVIINSYGGDGYLDVFEEAARQVQHVYGIPDEKVAILNVGYQQDDYNCGVWALSFFETTLRLYRQNPDNFNASLEEIAAHLVDIDHPDPPEYIRGKRLLYNSILYEQSPVEEEESESGSSAKVKEDSGKPAPDVPPPNKSSDRVTRRLSAIQSKLERNQDKITRRLTAIQNRLDKI
ncbi:hypothetical protein HN511_03860 [bacterium]|nr:hypothetical protein [bacterium]